MDTRVFWGLALVLLGFLFLLGEFGLFFGNPWNVFWPLLLVVLGFSLMFRRRSRAESFQQAAAAPTGTMTGETETRDDSASASRQTGSLPLDGATDALIAIRHGAGRLALHADAPSDQLFRGTFEGPIEKRVERTASRLQVALRPSDDQWERWLDPTRWWDGHGAFDWNVGVNPDVPLSLTLETGASQSLLDLTNLQVKDLTLKTGVSATTLTLPSHAGFTTVKIQTGLASIDVHVPSNVAARIHGTMAIGALKVNPSRFPPKNNAYESEGFDQAQDRVDITVEGGMGSVTVS